MILPPLVMPTVPDISEVETLIAAWLRASADLARLATQRTYAGQALAPVEPAQEALGRTWAAVERALTDLCKQGHPARAIAILDTLNGRQTTVMGAEYRRVIDGMKPYVIQ